MSQASLELQENSQIPRLVEFGDLFAAWIKVRNPSLTKALRLLGTSTWASVGSMPLPRAGNASSGELCPSPTRDYSPLAAGGRARTYKSGPPLLSSGDRSQKAQSADIIKSANTGKPSENVKAWAAFYIRHSCGGFIVLGSLEDVDLRHASVREDPPEVRHVSRPRRSTPKHILD